VAAGSKVPYEVTGVSLLSHFSTDFSFTKQNESKYFKDSELPGSGNSIRPISPLLRQARPGLA